MSENWKNRTKLVHGGTRRSQYNEVSEAIFLTQGFVYDTAEQAEARFQKAGEDEFIYARYGNPTMAMFEDRISGYLGYEDAFACASGMAAVNAALTALLKAGDHVVASRALFGSCLYVLQDILGRFGVEVTLVDGTDNEAWAAAIRPDTTLVFLESISNPTLEVIDLKHVCDLAHAVDALVLVDDAMATPVFSYAKACGADISIVSTTKHVDGQGRMLGGVICGPKDLIRGPIETYVKHTGGAMNPFTAWTHLKSLETMELRVRAQAATAERIAEALSGHSKLSAVRYPTHADHPQHDLARSQAPAGGTVLAFEVKGGKEACFRFLNALKLVTISNNFADAKSIATHPATTTHQRLPQDQKDILGISDGLVRFSAGLEDPEDLIADLEQALDKS
ncbi:aminotransferase class I/II-fold pyridoxal phosphate-dependent enzyme [Thalassovita aquimarina]|uniref:Aminotransferase class I/II-fold pyridoxal phosphate-dependent enzyme n=1 Tax=Thalassovita aquimarina TaxID=2785917 RepID=A0ABS5HV81_9RHOB|nr:aminotransferase class I/II-fold pyridoxal phosphate-dependent enzyme [Thalassovita aquimarina]MBR9652835.1 aminotransferase class I/II-fold pyridoxal phosphate-dependent enzyme [Thalassovita aquimarina]